MNSARYLAITIALTSTACASPGHTGTNPETTAKSSRVEAAKRDDAEVVTGSRIPVRGTQPVRTVDKEEITRNTSVIGTPPKGN